jgi:hypothetical protein
VLASVAAALRAQREPTRRWLCAAAALAGVALACKHNMVPVALVVLAALATVPAPTWRERAIRFLLAALAAAVGYLLLSPYTLLEAPSVLFLLKWQGQMFASGGRGLDLITLVRLGLGTGVSLLAVLGLLVAARSQPAATLAAAAFPIAYVGMLATGSLVYARYLAPLAPFAALFAGIGAAALGALAPRRVTALATAVLVVLAAGGPLRASVGYDRVLARADTRRLAGEWIRANVPPGTPLTLQAAHGYMSPVLPPDAVAIRRFYPRHADALLARGLGAPDATYPVRHLLGVFNQPLVRDPVHWRPDDGWVVLGRHVRLPQAGASDPTPFETALRTAGATPAAQFPSVVGDAQTVLYDPIDADFTPLAGFAALERPGPALTIWRVPPRLVPSRRRRAPDRDQRHPDGRAEQPLEPQ